MGMDMDEFMLEELTKHRFREIEKMEKKNQMEGYDGLGAYPTDEEIFEKENREWVYGQFLKERGLRKVKDKITRDDTAAVREHEEAVAEGLHKKIIDWLHDELENYVCEVKFRKVNGEERVFEECTRADVLIPEFSKPISVHIDSQTEKQKEAVAVWVLNEGGYWRSFRYDRLISIKRILPAGSFENWK